MIHLLLIYLQNENSEEIYYEPEKSPESLLETVVGNLVASEANKRITNNVNEALKLVDIELLDGLRKILCIERCVE